MFIHTMYRSTFLISMAMFLFVVASALHAPAKAQENPFILVDVASGKILAANKPHARWYPASLTKLMTAYVTFRAIAKGEIEEASPVIISAQARKQPPSKMGYKQGVKLRIDAALKIIIIKSANDVSLALAQAVAGGLPEFVGRMNAEARRLGMVNTQFANSNGLHSRAQFSSARDMAVLGSQIMREFPQYAYMFEAVAIRTSQKTHYSYNLLLERFRGANGMKTGFVCASGYNMVATAERRGRTLLAVVLGRNSQTDRAVSAAKLLDSGFKGPVSDLGSIAVKPSNASERPKNMRPVLCTEAARKNRYDPGAGQAKITSKFLSARTKSTNILTIKTGGTNGSQSVAVLRDLPIPTPSPLRKKLSPIGNIRTGIIALPTKRP